MPQFDQAARTAHYRAIRIQAWDDLRRQHDLYTKYWQESEGLGLGGAGFDESRFRGPVNLFLDELLTHSNAADARSIARSLPASWGASAPFPNLSGAAASLTWPSASPFSWSRAGTIAAVTATTIGLYAAVRWRLAKAESGKAR